MTTFKFDYALQYKAWDNDIGPPLLWVKLNNGDEELELPACVDTGAYAIIVDLKLFEPLGIDVYTGKETKVGGSIGQSGEPMQGFIHNLLITVEEIDFQCLTDVIVVPRYECPYVLLGREGFLNGLVVAFRENRQEMYFSIDSN